MPDLPARAATTTLAVLLASALLSLTACGGGGGAGGGTPPAPPASDNSWLSLAPAAVELATYTGEPKRFTLTATASRSLDGVIQVGIIDSQGVVAATETRVRELGNLSYEASLQTAPELAAGSYSGRFEVRLCRDNPLTCAQPIAGSPWFVPYRIQVDKATHLSPLTPLPGAKAWLGYQGDAVHSGFVDARLQASAFNRRWVRPVVAGPLAVQDGWVYVAPPASRAGAVLALAEHDGAERWRQGGNEFYSGLGLGPGRLWFMSTDSGDFSGTRLRALDATTGAILHTQALTAFSHSARLAPVVLDDSVFIASDRFATIGRHRAADATEQWRTTFGAPLTQPAYGWTPAVAAGRAVMFGGGRLWLADATTGADLGGIDGPDALLGQISPQWEVWGSPVLAGSMAYVSKYAAPNGAQPRLLGFNVQTRTLAWQVSETVRSNPVLAQGVVYVSIGVGASGRALAAYDAASGAPLWRWTAPVVVTDPSIPPPTPAPGSDSNQPLIVIGGHAFIGVSGQTHAIDLNSRQSVWVYPAAGPMAVSPQGTLFIAASDRLHAINLR